MHAGTQWNLVATHWGWGALHGSAFPMIRTTVAGLNTLKQPNEGSEQTAGGLVLGITAWCVRWDV